MSGNLSTKPYEVLVLGLQASGKTTLLASMPRTLSLLRQHIGFRLAPCDPDQESELTRIYESIITDEDWAPGTLKTTEWLFKCWVQSKKNGNSYPVLDISYIDAPGGWLEDGKGNEASQKFKEHIESADVYLFILDGHKILNLIHNTSGPDAFLYHDVFTVLKRIQNKSTPMHFVITKWDLLKSAGYSLAQVKDRLLANNDFSDVVANREGIVRLIPVSAVGDNFARWDGKKMTKIAGRGEPVPYSVEIPLACILVDQFNSRVTQRINDMRNEFHTRRFSLLPTQEFGLKAAISVSGGIVEFLQTVERINPIIMGSTIGITTLLEVYSSWKKDRNSRLREIEKLRERRDSSLNMIENLQDAVNSAIISCMTLVKQFEHANPDSVLDPKTVLLEKEKREMI